MKAYEIQQFGIDNLTLVERDEPKVNPTEVLVKFRAASLNYRDLMIVRGTYNPRLKMPAVPLSDGAGEIVTVGDAVTKWKVGDRVMPIFAQHWIYGDSTEQTRRSSLGGGAQTDGVLREFGSFDQEGLVRVPDHLSFEEAATLPCAALTAWHALAVSGKIKAGDDVLTLGTGGVSIFALQFAKIFGARVISTTGNDEKIEKLHGLGADDVINYRSREDWDMAVHELTDKKGVDHVVEVGGSGTLAKSIAAVRMGGHVAMIGALTGAGNFDPVSVFMKSVRLQGIFTGPRTMFEDMLKAIDVSKLEPVIDTVFDFANARDAIKYMESGAHFGKVVIKI
ncbi:MAG: NAD(P)-dependent alcohol dehydrogenase [Acidobacteria bacterium]|nr:MAG: NAD(P)-dependent alcohol dehydrogenase [Acidobacteriota bacterium]